MFIKLENDVGVTTTFEITQYTTQYGDPDEIDSPRDSYFLTVWRNDGMSEDFILLSRKTYIKHFTKIGSLTDGPWSSFYIMNNEGKTIDRFRIPELWRKDEPTGITECSDTEEDEVRVGIPRRAGGSI